MFPLSAPAPFVHCAIPPPALSRLLLASGDDIVESFGYTRERLSTVLRDSMYQHLGIAWHFDTEFTNDLPLGGHNVRRDWHPILVQHSQYRDFLRPPSVTVVTGSVCVDTEFRHARLGTLAQDHDPDEFAQILWDDERGMDVSLPRATGHDVFGISSASQIVRHGPLSMKGKGVPVYLATGLNGQAPNFTASLESAIQAGAAAAAALGSNVARLGVLERPFHPHV